MLLLLLTCVTHALATSYTVYIQRSGQTYMYIWNSKKDDTSWGKANKVMTLVPGTSDVWKYTVELKAGANSFNCIFMNASTSSDGAKVGGDQTITASGWLFSSDANSHSTGYTEPTFTVSYNVNGGSGSTSSHTSVAYNASVTLRANGFTRSNYTFAGWNTAANGTGTYYAPGASYTVTANKTFYAMWVKTSVLNNTDVMAYCGELKSWNQSKYQFKNSSGTKLADISISTEVNVVDEDYKTGVVTLAPNTTYYNQGHWDSDLDCKIQAGYLYVVRGSKSSSYFTQKDNSGSNYLYEVSQQNSSTAATRTVTTTLGSSSLAEGTSNLSVSTSGGPGKSVLGRTNKLLYFLYNGSTWSLVQLSAGNLNVSSLTDGSYSLASVLTDGYIYVRADKDDFNVYAVYSIAYKDQGNVDYSGSNLASLPTSYNHGTGIATLTDGQKTGYNFVGWYENSSCTGDAVTSISSSATGNKTFYAKWTEDLASYTVSFNMQGHGSAISDQDVESGGTVEEPSDPSATGYTFGGWYKEAGCTNEWDFDDDKVTEETILYAKWTAKTYTAADNLDKNGGDSHGQYTATYYNTSIVVNTPPARSGYTIEGYYKEVGCTNKIAASAGALVASTSYTDGSSHWTNDGNETLYTNWTPNPYTITFNGNKGSRSGTVTNIQATVTVTYDNDNFNISSTPVSSVDIPVLTGYTFGGYYTGIDGAGTQIVAANGAWIVPGSGNGNSYLDDSGNWVKAANTTVYAKWTAKTTTVTLDKQSGSGGTNSVTATYDAAMPSATMPTRTGYDFGGYYTETAGGGTGYYTSGGASARNWNITDATKTLYAKWTLHNYTITYNLDGGTNSPSNPATYTITDALITLQNPTKRGYNFDGWYTNSDKTTSGNTIAAGSHENKTFWAKWTAKENVTVKFKNTDNWDHVYAYAWDGSGTLNGGWPGGEIYESDGWYTYSLKWGANIIFNSNDNNKKTQDLTGIEEDICYIWDHGSAGIDSDCDGIPEYDTRTIFVHVANDWSESALDIYTWGDGSGRYNSNSFPGSTHEKGGSMTEPIGGRWFKVTINNACANFKLSCNSSSKQTNDLTLSNYDDGTCWDATNGAVLSTTSCPSVPSVTNGSGASSVQDVQATLNGTSSSSPLTITEYGFYYSSSESTQDGLIENGTKVTGTGSASSFSYTATGLSTGTTYYYIAYAVNGKGIAYASSPSSFTTKFQLNYAIGDVKGGDGDIASDPSTSSGSYVLSGTKITLTAPDEKTGYTWKGWYGAANGSGDQLCSTQEYALTITANTTVYACYTEDMHTVTVTTDGHGSITTPAAPATTVSAGIATGASIATSASTGYTFYNWTKTSGDGTVTFTNANANSTTVKATSDATVQANFVDTWNIKGDQWSSWAYQPMSATANDDEYSKTFTLTKGTKYQFKVVQRTYNGSGVGTTDVWYGNKDDAGNKVFERGESAFTTVAGGMNNNLEVTADVSGDYTFTINTSGETPTITITYQSAYTVTFGNGVGGNTITASGETDGAITSGEYVKAGDDITFAQTAATGYTFKGWYNAESGGTEISCMSDEDDNVYDNIAGNISVYAQYTPNPYAITFDATTNGGAIVSGSSPQNVIFDETSVGSCPTAAKEGYCFDGWYTAATGGKLLIAADGTLQANVSDGEPSVQYTDGDRKWKKTSATTVYAVYAAPTIEMTKTPTSNLYDKAPDKDTIVIHQSLSCTPAGNYNIAYTVGYAVNHTQLAEQPTIKYGTGDGVGHDTIKMPVSAGVNMYEVVATLRTGTTRGEGDVVRRDTIRADVETKYTVKLRYMVDGVDIRESTEWYLYPTIASLRVKAPLVVEGYVLDSWSFGSGITKDPEMDDVIDEYVHTKYCFAANPGTIILNYKTRPNGVYFKNNAVGGFYSTRVRAYDYTTVGYWSGDDKGSGAKGKDSLKFTYDSNDDVFWSKTAFVGTTTKMSLTNDPQKGVENFGDEGSVYVAYRTDYNSATSLFVPVSTGDDDYFTINGARYYRGFWTKYSHNIDSTGYYLKIYNKKTKADAPYADEKDPELVYTVPLRLTKTGAGDSWELTATVDLEGGKTYGFKYTKAHTGGTQWFGNNGTMTTAYHVGWTFSTAESSNCGLTTTSAGEYTFHIFCKAYDSASETNVQGKPAVTVDYATLNDDYRVYYADATQTEPIVSQTLHKRAEGLDTVSFFVREDDDSRVMKFQKFNGSTSKWDDVASGDIDLSGITKDSIYVFYVEQNEGATSISVTGHDYYDGEIYIRTDCVDEYKWDYKHSLNNHKMVETDYGMTASQPFKFSHYYVHWVDKSGNVKYVIANKYAPCLTDTVITDLYADVAGGNLPSDHGANIRFMYNKSTNATQRAYLSGTQGSEWSANSLKLTEYPDANKMQNTSGTTIDNITFTDQGNWTYTASIKAIPGLKAQLTAEYNSQTQYFKGTAEQGAVIVSGDSETPQAIDMTYDFKTNRLICAWRPSGDSIKSDISINADVMIIRKAQGDAEQIRFNNDGALSDVKYIYGVIQFDYDDMYGKMSRWDYLSYEQCMYYISFPYDVLVNDIMGAGTMGVDWRLQRYNGAKRAANGWFAGDGVTTFWEDLQPGDTLHAYEGYGLLLNRNRFNGSKGNIWDNKGEHSSVYLFFPSVTASTGIVHNESVKIHVPEHECTIDRSFTNSRGVYVNHKVTDSHWNMIGTPLFEDKKASTIVNPAPIEGQTLNYIYEWSYWTNTLMIAAVLNTSFEFKTMYSYMAQYAGDITFSGSTVNKIVAAKRNEEKKNYHVNLELTKDDVFTGRTYVELRENAVDSFLLNEDICMFRNGVNADLFTYAGGYEAGANVLPVGNHTVPVGIDVKKAGTYTFSMPSNFDGEVTLVDTYAQTRTNLLIEDYEVALNKGEITDRFYLEINVNKVPTAIDGTAGASLKDGKAHKFIEDQQMYILKNGVIYDARGNRVK